MNAVAVQSPVMADKKKASSGAPKSKPRLTVVMEPTDRNRVRFVALRLGEPVEQMAARWVLERCAIEEKRLGIK